MQANSTHVFACFQSSALSSRSTIFSIKSSKKWDSIFINRFSLASTRLFFHLWWCSFKLQMIDLLFFIYCEKWSFLARSSPFNYQVWEIEANFGKFNFGFFLLLSNWDGLKHILKTKVNCQESGKNTNCEHLSMCLFLVRPLTCSGVKIRKIFK